MATKVIVRPTRSETAPQTMRPRALKIASQPTAAAPWSIRELRSAAARVPAASAAATSCSPAKTLMMPMTIRPAMAPLKNISHRM